MTLRFAEPSAAAVAELGARLAAVSAGAERRTWSPWTYLLVTPLGMPARDWLATQLEGRGLRLEARLELRDWARISTAVQVRSQTADSLRRAVLYEAAWRALFPGEAEAWRFAATSHPRLVAAKPALRLGVPRREVQTRPRGGDLCVLHGFHLADEGDAALEAKRFEAATG